MTAPTDGAAAPAAVSKPEGDASRRDGPPRVVVIGAGFGGLAAVRALRRAPVDVTWIDRRNHHLFQPLLYQVATAALSPADIAAPVREIARGWSNVEVLMGEVVDISREERRVRTREQTLPYDHLVVATGAETSYFGKATWARRAEGLKDLEEAVAIRRRILLALERAETASSEQERRRLLSFVLIGAGPTGVEMAGAISDLAKNMLVRDYRHVGAETISIVLVEAMGQVLPGFPPDLADYTERKLGEMGIDVRTGTMVDEMDDRGVVAGGERIDAAHVIWSAGVKATPVAEWLGVEADRKGRAKVLPDLSLPDDSRVFVIGDAALAIGRNGEPLPGLAAVAKQQGTFVGRRIASRVAGRRVPEAFRYRDYGTLATIGRRAAVADLGRVHLRGSVGWFVWAVVHVWYLVAFRNRIRIIVNWAWQYLAYTPGARLITGETDRT